MLESFQNQTSINSRAPLISAVIVTINSSEFIAGCLESLSWTDEIVVVDLGSQDGTLEILESRPVVLIKHAWVPFADLIRDFGADHATGEWILHIDPDERVSSSLAAKLREIALSDVAIADAVHMPRQNIVFGRWMKYGGYWPDPQVRFGRKSAIHFSGNIHETGQIMNGKVLELSPLLENALTHYPVPRLSALMERLNRYAQSHAQELYVQGHRFDLGHLLADPLSGFYHSFFEKQAYRDGVVGLIFTLVWHFIYPLFIQLYLWELSGQPGAQAPDGSVKPTLGIIRKALHYPEIRILAKRVFSQEIPLIRKLASARHLILRKTQ